MRRQSLSLVIASILLSAATVIADIVPFVQERNVKSYAGRSIEFEDLFEDPQLSKSDDYKVRPTEAWNDYQFRSEIYLYHAAYSERMVSHFMWQYARMLVNTKELSDDEGDKLMACINGEVNARNRAQCLTRYFTLRDKEEVEIIRNQRRRKIRRRSTRSTAKLNSPERVLPIKHGRDSFFKYTRPSINENRETIRHKVSKLDENNATISSFEIASSDDKYATSNESQLVLDTRQNNVLRATLGDFGFVDSAEQKERLNNAFLSVADDLFSHSSKDQFHQRTEFNMPQTLLEMIRTLKGKSEQEMINEIAMFNKIRVMESTMSDAEKLELFMNLSGIIERRDHLLALQKYRNMTFSEHMELVSYDIIEAARQLNETGNFRLLSPKLYDYDLPSNNTNSELDVLSPTLFSITKNDSMISLPRVLQVTGARHTDDWLQLINEVSGITTQISGAMKLVEQEKKSSEERLILAKAHLRYLDTIDQAVESFDEEKKEELTKNGFTTMTEHQIDIMFNNRSATYNEEVPVFELKKFARLSKAMKKKVIEGWIYNVAGQENQRPYALRSWQKKVFDPIVGVSVIGTPVTLGPFVKSPLALDSIIRSPLTLSPLVLSPGVLLPIILSPFVLSPIVLSPRALSPVILSPLVLDPVTISPHVLSPFILDPLVFTPHVISPFVLSPLILNPGVGSPLVISPIVLSPLILSPQALFAAPLSPLPLSPRILSPIG